MVHILVCSPPRDCVAVADMQAAAAGVQMSWMTGTQRSSVTDRWEIFDQRSQTFTRPLGAREEDNGFRMNGNSAIANVQNRQLL